MKRIFDAARNSLVKSFKGSSVLSEKESLLNKKYPERDIDFEVNGTDIRRTRFILTKTTFYQVTVRGPKDYVDGPEAKKFIDSFKLKD